ncbi:GNAT family N-acetyltransferase [Kitasatospora sp. Ki12]
MDDLVTERLILCPLDPALARRIAANAPQAGDRWEAGYPSGADVAGARRFLEVCGQDGGTGPFGAYEIRRRGDGHAIGGAGFHGPADPQGGVSVGYGLVPAARGHGYASEALRALLSLARELGATRVRGDTDLANTASRHVMAACGMRPAGQDERLAYYETVWTTAPPHPDPPPP